MVVFLECSKPVLTQETKYLICRLLAKSIQFLLIYSQKILKRGQEAGMAVNFHAEELKYIGGVEMGAKIGVSWFCVII